MDEWTDGWVGVTVSPHEPMEGQLDNQVQSFTPPSSLIRTGTTFCLCTSASSENKENI